MSEDTIDVLENDVDHRIANNLAIIAGLLRRKTRRLKELSGPMSATDVRGILEEVAFQIEVVASLHKALSKHPAGGRIDLDQYLRSVCNAAFPSLSIAGGLTPEYGLGCGLRVTPDFAVSVALAVAELLTNAIRHAHPSGVEGKIVVAARSSGDELVIEVVDDGAGLPDGYDPSSDGSVGLRLVRQTAARWGGRVEFISSEHGLCVRLVLPAGQGTTGKQCQ